MSAAKALSFDPERPSLTGCDWHDTPKVTGIEIIDDARRRESPRFFGIPDRWYETPSWRCVNGHVSTSFLKSEKLGDACLSCHGPVFMTFPEDKEEDRRNA